MNPIYKVRLMTDDGAELKENITYAGLAKDGSEGLLLLTDKKTEYSVPMPDHIAQNMLESLLLIGTIDLTEYTATRVAK